MIFLQIDPLSKPVAITEMLVLLAAAAFIGWLVARWIVSGQINALRQSLAEQNAALDECRSRHATITRAREKSQPINHFVSPGPIVSVPDNLKLVEGIGPKIEELLHADGIYTFARLATTSPEHLAILLRGAGPRFQMHDPGTWPDQAALARDGKWEELKAMQESLKAGRGQ